MDAQQIAPHGYPEIVKFFGDPMFDGVNVSPKWERANMVSARDLPGLTHSLYVHRLIEAPLRRALTRCVGFNDGYRIWTIGCFAPRLQRGSERVSVHTFGGAVDLNAAANRLIICGEEDPRRQAPGARDIPPAWVHAFTDEGFTWGGLFHNRFDPMHFQYCSGF